MTERITQDQILQAVDHLIDEYSRVFTTSGAPLAEAPSPEEPSRFVVVPPLGVPHPYRQGPKTRSRSLSKFQIGPNCSEDVGPVAGESGRWVPEGRGQFLAGND
jgi:hypothetical protein